MIDWANVIVPFEHETPINGGGVMHIDPDGVCSSVLPKFAQVEDEGSYRATVKLQTSREHLPLVREPSGPYCSVATRREYSGEVPVWTHVWVSGSPKFLQGHNLFGTSDPIRFAVALADRALSVTFARGLGGRAVEASDRARWLAGDFQLSVLDITEMLDVGSDTNASAWLRAAGEHIQVKHRGAGANVNGTLYIGKTSRLWALKFYDKRAELASRSYHHRLPDDIPHRDELQAYAQGTVRVELRLLSMELKRQALDTGRAWINRSAREVWEGYMSRVNLAGNVPLRDHQIERLPSHLRSTYVLWVERRDVPAILSRRTFYRHRTELRAYGIDITTPPERSGVNVVPLIRIIEARPKGIPEWAIGTRLLAA